MKSGGEINISVIKGKFCADVGGSKNTKLCQNALVEKDPCQSKVSDQKKACYTDYDEFLGETMPVLGETGQRRQAYKKIRDGGFDAQIAAIKSKNHAPAAPASVVRQAAAEDVPPPLGSDAGDGVEEEVKDEGGKTGFPKWLHLGFGFGLAYLRNAAAVFAGSAGRGRCDNPNGPGCGGSDNPDYTPVGSGGAGDGSESTGTSGDYTPRREGSVSTASGDSGEVKSVLFVEPFARALFSVEGNLFVGGGLGLALHWLRSSDPDLHGFVNRLLYSVNPEGIVGYNIKGRVPLAFHIGPTFSGVSGEIPVGPELPLSNPGLMTGFRLGISGGYCFGQNMRSCLELMLSGIIHPADLNTHDLGGSKYKDYGLSNGFLGQLNFQY